MRADSILDTIKTFTAMLKPYCVELTVGGSVRREKPDVKDVELIVMPKPSLMPFLDKLVLDGTISKALYGEAKPTARWGERYRGLWFKGVKFEVFVYDTDNRAYLLWLRTGPGDANAFVMDFLSKANAPFGFQTWAYFGTRVWKKGKKEFVPDMTRKLRLSSEADMFTLLGMEFIEPRDRSVERYKALMLRKSHTLGDPAQFLIETVRAQVLFDDLDAPVRAGQAAGAQRLNKIEMANVPPYQKGSSFEDERQELVRQFMAIGEMADPTEAEVCDFAIRRYNFWERSRR